MSEFKSRSLAEQVFRKLESDIILGVYARGEIITELKLVEELGVSRTPIREALQRLEQERLIQDTGKGSLVLGITEEDLIDIMSIRKYVEGLAVYHVAQKISDAEKKELANIMDLHDFYAAKKDLEHMREMDEEFHDAIYRMSGSTVMCDTLMPLHRKTRRYRQNSITDNERMILMCKEHRAIYDAIIAGDAPLAEKLMQTHVANALQSMKERMNKNG